MKPSKRPARFPGWRTMSSAERYNARMHRIFEEARELQAEKDEKAARKLEASRPDMYHGY